jgi:hypothetical protein
MKSLRGKCKLATIAKNNERGPPKLLLLCCNYGLITVKTVFPRGLHGGKKCSSHTQNFRIKNMFETAIKFANITFYLRLQTRIVMQ